MIKIIYNSPAVPQEPYDFVLNTKYELNKVKGKYVILINDNDRREFDIDFIKSMFKPCEGYSWDMLKTDVKETNLKRKNKINKNKIENNEITKEEKLC